MNEKSKKVKEAKINKKSHITLHTSQNKGITLVALIITIIVLLILAVVAIRAVQGDGIISHAKNAQTGYEKAQAQESSILSGYEIELAKNTPASFSNEMTSTKFEKTTFVKDVKGKIFAVPAGYTIVKDATTANIVEVDKGVVITDKVDESGKSIGNEFVWVPVNNINSMAKVTSGTDANGRTNYQGVLYDFTSTGATEQTNYGQGTESYREPDVVTKKWNGNYTGYIDGSDKVIENLEKAGCTVDLNGDKVVNENDFKIKLQTEYNRMVESVGRYGGFYVGRYEMSLNASGNAQSKSGVPSATAEETSANTWYGLYAKAKTYTNSENSVVSNMIYGSQYDAMMRWMQSNGIDVTSSTPIDTTGTKASYNTTRVTGAKGSTDKLNNVYDLLGNSFELTQEAYDTLYRVYRGGFYGYSVSPSGLGYYPTIAFSSIGSRLSLYIK